MKKLYTGLGALLLLFGVSFFIQSATIDLTDMPNESSFGNQVKAIINANIDAIQTMLNFSGDATLGVDGVVTVTGAAFTSLPTTTNDVGDINTNTVTSVVEYGDGVNHKTVLTLSGAPLAIADGDFENSYVLYTFPEGSINLDGVVVDVTATMLTTNFNASTDDLYNWGMGSTTNDDGDGTISATGLDMCPNVSVDTVSGTQVVNAVQSVLAASTSFDGTSTAITMNLNWAVPAANDSGDNTNTFTGTVTFPWKLVGDY